MSGYWFWLRLTRPLPVLVISLSLALDIYLLPNLGLLDWLTIFSKFLSVMDNSFVMPLLVLINRIISQHCASMLISPHAVLQHCNRKALWYTAVGMYCSTAMIGLKKSMTLLQSKESSSKKSINVDALPKVIPFHSRLKF